MAKTRSRSRSRSRSASPDKPRLSTVAVVAAVLLLPIAAMLIFVDSLGVAYGWFIGLVWWVAALAAFIFGLIYYGQFVVPRYKKESWSRGISMLWRNSGRVVSTEPPSRTGSEEKVRAITRQLPPSFQRLQAGLVPSHQALAVSRGVSFTRAAGPGFVQLQGGEHVGEVVDLRRHSRGRAVEAHTRDGIPVETKVSVTFRVRPSQDDPRHSDLEYPYNERAIFSVVHASSVDQADSLIPWSEQLAPQAATYVVSEVAQYSLNELSQNPDLTERIKTKVLRKLQEDFGDNGIVVQNVGIGTWEWPEAVMQQRLLNWQAPWQRRLHLQEAARDAEVTRRMQEARGRAQVEIIQAVAQNISAMREASDGNLSSVVTLRMIEVLEEAGQNEQLHKLIPEQLIKNLVDDTSRQMRALLAPPAEDRES